MTTVLDQTPQPSPWLSVWLSPRDTIERILRIKPRRDVLLLAALASVSNIMFAMVDHGLMATLLDWRIIAAVLVGGAALGVVTLYVSGLMFRWSGKIMGGGASSIDLRAVLAWGNAPTLIGLAVCLIALAGLELFGNVLAPERASHALSIALQVIAGVLALWSLVATMLMLA